MPVNWTVHWTREWKKEIKQYSTEQLREILRLWKDYNPLYIELVRQELMNRPDLQRVSMTLQDLMDFNKIHDRYRQDLHERPTEYLLYIINSGMFHDWLVNLAIEEYEKRTGKIIIPNKILERM